MKIGYCALWMPTIIHKNFDTPIISVIDFFELSDNVVLKKDDEHLFARIEMVNNNIQIDIYRRCVCNYELLNDYSANLIFEDYSHNGMFLYGIDVKTENNPFFCENDGTPKIPCAIYHRIKEFYHQHNFHKLDDGDSMLPPFVSSTKIDIKSDDNKALLHYLVAYELKFISSFEFLEKYFNKLNKNSILSKILFFLGWDTHASFYMMTMRIKGDKAYFNTLCSSKYNLMFKMSGSADCNDEYRRKYFNIHNIFESVDTMENRISSIFNMSVARISFWIAILAVFLSVLFYFFNK